MNKQPVKPVNRALGNGAVYTRTPRPAQRGFILLAVMWLAAALSLMALAVSFLVRTEAASAANAMDSTRGYFAARGAIDAAIYALATASSDPSATSNSFGGSDPVAGNLAGQLPAYRPGQRWYPLRFGEGSSSAAAIATTAIVEIVPENAKLSVNQAPPEQLAALFTLLGAAPESARELAAAIAGWRAPRSSGVESELDLFYAQANTGGRPAVVPRHAPFKNLEELLLVKGMTREMFYGWPGHLGSSNETPAERDAPGRRLHPPLAELLTTDEVAGGINVNFAAAQVLQVLPGWTAEMVAAVLEARAASARAGFEAPFRTMDELQRAVPGVATTVGITPVTLASGTVFTLLASGGTEGQPVRRTIRARVRIDPALPGMHRVIAWWDDWPWSEAVSDRLGTSGEGQSGEMDASDARSR